MGKFVIKLIMIQKQSFLNILQIYMKKSLSKKSVCFLNGECVTVVRA